MNVHVQPQLLRWARERVSWEVEDVAKAFGWKKTEKIVRWEETGELSFAHLERLAAKTYTPIGFLFLDEVPTDELPIPDFRRLPGAAPSRPSPNLLETIFSAQARQDWFRDYLLQESADRLGFVGSATERDDPIALAREIRETVGLTSEARRTARTYEETIALMIERLEEIGILVMRNGVVGNNTHRKLDVAEFRGFVLSDDYVPLVFINAADAKSAQMFTLAHEVVHIWLNQSGVSRPTITDDQNVERFCNAVAAEILLPVAEFKEAWAETNDAIREARRIARRFKVSSLVVLIRALDAGLLSAGQFNQLYDDERAEALRGGGTGGDFYRTQGSRLGKRFARAVVVSALEGRTLYGEAFSLLGLKRVGTFQELARRLGVIG